MKKMKNYTKITSQIRAKVTFNCPHFEFHKFPFDEQLCSLLMRPSHPGEFVLDGFLIISKTFDLAKANLQYMVKMLNVSDSPDKKYAQTYSAIGITFHLKRYICPYLR